MVGRKREGRQKDERRSERMKKISRVRQVSVTVSWSMNRLQRLVHDTNSRNGTENSTSVMASVSASFLLFDTDSRKKDGLRHV
jgi:hypothetical protein